MAGSKVTIDVEARFVDNVTGKAKQAEKTLENLGKQAEKAQKKATQVGKKGKTKLSIDLDDSKAVRKLRSTESKLSKLGKGNVKLVLKAEDKASNVVNKVNGKVSKLNGKRLKLTLIADDKASNTTSKVLGKVKSFAGKAWTGILKLKDSNALGTIQKITNAAQGFTKKAWSVAVKVKDMATAPLRGIKNTLFSIKSLVVAITAGMAAKQFVADPIGLADAYSSAKIGFSTLLGESQGQQMMNDLDDFAKATPFKSSEVINQSQRMIAMGWDAKNIIKDMETIGDAAAATGKGEQGLQQIVTALAQIKTKGKLSTEELNQLAEAGVSAKRYVAEGLGYGSGDEGIAKMTKDLEDGKIASGKALDALLSGMKEYQGMMDKTANETVGGLWSQIQDTFEIGIFRRWGQGLQEGAKKGIGAIVDLLDSADGSITKFGDKVYEVGAKISTWASDKLIGAVDRIKDITGSFEFKNASFGEKISMLWKGAVADPLKDWWNNINWEPISKKAGEMGGKLGKLFSNGTKKILGITDVLDGGELESGAAGVAQSFAKSFVDNFDVSGITQKVIDAIGNVWGALPAWGKLLVGGFAAGKAVKGISSLVGGIGTIAGGAKKFIGSAANGTGLLGFGSKAAIKLGAGNLAGGASLGAGALSALGLAGVAGGVAAGASTIKGGIDLYGAYKAYKGGDTTEAKAKGASGGTALGGTAAGAAAGAAIGSVVPVIGTAIGALVGAGVGGVAGWIGGNKWADSIRSAKVESEELKDAIKDTNTSSEELAATWEKAVYENMKSHMGDIKLSASEISRMADQLVWGDKLAEFDKFTQAQQTAQANLESLNAAGAETDKWMWKASLGVKFNSDEIDSIKSSFDEYINGAKAYVENKHYEFTAAVSMLVDVKSKEGKNILQSGNAFFGDMQKKLDAAGKDLGNKLSQALKDGIITADESAAIMAAQQKIADITNKIADSEAEAKLDVIKLKFGGGNLDLDTYDAFAAQLHDTIEERMSASEEALEVGIAGIRLQVKEGALSKEEGQKQIDALVAGYKVQVDELRAEVTNVQLDIMADAYGDELGADAKAKLQGALNKALSEGIDPIKWSPDQVRKILGVDSLSEESAGAIAQMLSGLYGELKLIEVDGKILLDLGIETDGDPEQELKDSLPETVEETVGVNISGEEHIQNTIDVLASDFGIPPEHAATVALLLTGHKDLLNKIDVSALAKEFGIPESQAKTIIEKLTGAKSIENRLQVLAGDFGVPDSISKKISVNITAIKGKVTNLIGNVKAALGIGEYRGGIVGGPSAMGSFARGGIAGYSNGGIVRGGSRLITVAEEGSPEMVIPLSSQRRNRALKLWAQAGHMMDVPGFAQGGLTNGGPDNGVSYTPYEPSGDTGGQGATVDVGGINVTIQVDATGHENIAEAIQAQREEIAEAVAEIMQNTLKAQFENKPARGGVA